MWRLLAVCLLACGSAQQPKPVDNRAPASPATGSPAADDPEQQRNEAALAAETARIEAEAARRDVDTAQGQLVIVDKHIDAAVTKVTEAQNQAERDAAKQELDLLRKERVEVQARLQAAKEAAARAERRTQRPRD